MNYAELPLHERIQHAANYALILKDDPLKTPEQVIEELSATFFLSQTEATTAYQLSKKDFPGEYKAAKKAKTWHYIVLILTSLLAGGYYLFFSRQPGFGFMIAFAIFFFLSVLAIINIAFKNLSENTLIRYPVLKHYKKNFFFQLFPGTLFFFAACFCQFQFQGIIKQQDLAVKKLVLAEKITHLESGGKSSYWYYNFQFRGYTKAFHFDSYDYKYADTLPAFKNYEIGDSITIEILKNDIEDLNTKSFFSKYNRIVSTWVNGKSIINYDKRYQRIINERKKRLTISFWAFLINITIIGLILRFPNTKREG
ncbi:hypothetical protein [Ferruginibacter sp.]